LFLVVAISVGLAQVNLGTHNGCTATDADFSHKTLVTFDQNERASVDEGPIKMAFRARGTNKPDVYVVRKGGDIYKYDGLTGNVKQVGSLNNVISIKEDGLVGIALDPDFNTNNIIYLMYSTGTQGDSKFRISYFTMANDVINLGSEKVLIETPTSWDRWHTGGAMKFDRHGDLWIAIGDNQETEFGPGNTADFKGSIIRIHPNTIASKGYTIPNGNFGQHFQAYWQGQGQAALAAEYADPAVVLPELYVKGLRNPYTLSIDPKFGWLAWGDVGPDREGGQTEEHNLVTEPGYMGWPYWAGTEHIESVYDDAGLEGGSKNTPINNFQKNPPDYYASRKNFGVTRLPPVNNPIFVRAQACAMNGPIFRYNGANPSPTQFPPQFDGHWMVGGCNSYGFRIVDMNDNGTMNGQFQRIFDNGSMNPSKLVDLQQGPDGAIYYLEHASKQLSRIEYKGSCKDPNMILSIDKPKINRQNQFALKGNLLEILVPGEHEVKLIDVFGKVYFTGVNEQIYEIVKPDISGIYFLQIKTEAGSWNVKRAFF